MKFTAKEAVEVFHLLFMNSLCQRVEKSLLTLKGGCNLRFFFKSIRYSEDIDFDVHTIAVHTLKKNVDTLLAAPAFKLQLQAKGIELVSASAPKQTETTQRWKIGLQVKGISTTVPTKVEFSRRQSSESSVYEAVDSELVSRYQLLPVLCQHYVLDEAVVQKIAALIGRAETQARDVFDLDLLIKKHVNSEKLKGRFRRDDVELAVENVMSVSYDVYQSQVTAFLMPEYREHFDTRSVWDKMQTQLLTFLESLK